MSTTIRDRGLIRKDPADSSVYEVDWNAEALPASAAIADSDFELIGVSGDITATPLTADQASVLSGSRKTQIRLTGGAVGSKWRINNRITTNETPAQIIERSFFVLVENL